MNRRSNNRSLNRRRSNRRQNFTNKTKKVEQLKEAVTKAQKGKSQFKNKNNKIRSRKSKERFNNRVYFDEMVRRIVKYLVEGLAVGVVGMLLVMRSKKNINWDDQSRNIIVMSVTAAAVFAVLDMWAPAIAGSTRQGAGFGLGAKMVGFP